MQLTPRYGDEPVLRFESVIADPASPLLRQRARLAALLAGLTDDQWAAASRCAGWSVQDVVAHLVTTNQFWAFSITAGLQGEPSRFLASFDPVASPAQMVEAVRSWSPTEARTRFDDANAALADAVAAIGAADDPDPWALLAETPPGHLSLRALALHALWDSWIHERDIAVPLGLDPVLEADEIAAALAYVAGLGPAFAVLGGSTRQGALDLRATDPDLRFVVHLDGGSVTVDRGPAPTGAVVVTADAVALCEALSLRAPFPVALADGDRWLLGALDVVFDQA